MNRYEKILSAVKLSYEYVQTYNLFPEKQHKSLASVCSKGAKAYYDNEIELLLKEAPNKSMVANAWVNDVMPDITPEIVAVTILNYIDSLNSERYKTFGVYADDDEDEITKKSADAFWRIYYAYNKLNELRLQYTTTDADRISPESAFPPNKRDIDTKTLEQYFIPAFKGMGNGSIDYFAMMVRELETDRSAKQFGQIALMAFEGSQMNHRKPARFRGWYTIFCECVGCDKKSYNKKDLRNPSDNLKGLFNYLQ